MLSTQGGTYFQQVSVVDIPDDRKWKSTDALVVAAIKSGGPELTVEPGDRARLALPVYRAGEITSMVLLEAQGSDDATGVMEIWQPVGSYAELKLTTGTYGKLERFQNVSSFIRFEHGSGLPGQVWGLGRAVVQNDLSNHPGFLRAAGASAGALQTAIGIPVVGEQFFATVVLISSSTSPLAKGYEVWCAEGPGFELVDAAYPEMPRALQLKIGHVIGRESGMPGLAAEHGGAIKTVDQALMHAAREETTGLESALAIPTYRDHELDSVSVLYF